MSLLKSLSHEQSLIIIESLLKNTSDETTKTLNNTFKELIELNCHHDIIKLLLKDNRIDVCANNNHIIQFACKNGLTDIVKLLLQNSKIDPTTSDNYAIISAAENNHTDIIKLLFQDKRSDPSARNNLAFKSAVKNGHVNIVKILLTDKRVDPSTENNFAIKQSSENGYADIVEILLKLTPNKNFVDGMRFGLTFTDKSYIINPGVSNNYPIRIASQNGHLDVVKLLLNDSRVNPQALDNSAIKLASEYGHLEVVKILLDREINPGAGNNYPIRLASQNGHYEIVKLLLLDVQVDPSAGDNYAIKSAFANNHINVVKLLIQKIDINKITDVKILAIAKEVKNPKSQTIQTLEALFEDEKCNSNFFNKMFDAAISTIDMEVINYLLENNKIDPSYNDNRFIKNAFARNLPEVVKLLSSRINMSEIYDIRIHNMIK